MNKLGLQDKMRKFWKKNGGCYLFLIPAFIGFFVFSVYPVVLIPFIFKFYGFQRGEIH